MPNDPNDTHAAVTGALALEIYKDVLKPSANRIGISLEGLVKLALAPADMLNWGFENSKDWLKEKIESRLRKIPADCIKAPPAAILKQAVESVSMAFDQPALRELYAELLLKSMDTRSAHTSHPAFFYIVGQLVPEEAMAIAKLYQMNKTELFRQTINNIEEGNDKTLEDQFGDFCKSILPGIQTPAAIWLTNLCRLGVLNIRTITESVFQTEDLPEYRTLIQKDLGHVDNIEHHVLILTSFGREFVAACTPDAQFEMGS